LIPVQRKKDGLGIKVAKNGEQLNAKIQGCTELTKCHLILSNNNLPS